MPKKTRDLGKEIKGRKAGRAAALTRSKGRQDQPQSENANAGRLPTVVWVSGQKDKSKEKLPSRNQVNAKSKKK
jgi:hypothetical protein